MSSSISSSDGSAPAIWRRLAWQAVAWAAGVLGIAYLFVCLVDPWDILPLSPPLPRVPISTNARFSFPALARSARFDSVVLGTSTARLLRPEVLDTEFGARFANLAMNSATAWEQMQMLAVFARAHPDARAVLIGLDAGWCDTAPARTTPRPFPEWMYRRNPWRAYAHMANLYAIQEAANQFAVVVGLKRRRYGLDGYTNFLPPDSAYDPVRVEQAFARWGPPDLAPVQAIPTPTFPALPLLRDGLAALPDTAHKVLFFAPYHIGRQGGPGSGTARMWAACKADAARIAAESGAVLVDFMRPTAITEDQAHYWDPLHYRVPIADRVMRDLKLATQGQVNADFALLAGPGPTPLPPSSSPGHPAASR